MCYQSAKQLCGKKLIQRAIFPQQKIAEKRKAKARLVFEHDVRLFSKLHFVQLSPASSANVLQVTQCGAHGQSGGASANWLCGMRNRGGAFPPRVPKVNGHA